MALHPDLDVILASSSPRRRDLLAQIGVSFRVLIPNVDEDVLPGEMPRDYALRTAAAKCRHIFDTRRSDAASPFVVVAADTVVTLEGRILGKPTDDEDACSMLRTLSGRTHQVISGLSLLGRAKDGTPMDYLTAVSTDVEMKPLAEEEVRAYVASGEPADKAGAYAIQGKAAYMVRSIRGSYTNVVGLPLAELEDALCHTFGCGLGAAPPVP